MKKLTIVMIAILFVTLAFLPIVAATTTQVEPKTATGQIADMKKTAENKLSDYIDKYGSESYGLAAYILNLVRIYSIPFCFIGIAVGGLHQYVLGIRKLDTRDKGLALIITFVTIFVICQVLPLIYAIVVRGFRG